MKFRNLFLVILLFLVFMNCTGDKSTVLKSLQLTSPWWVQMDSAASGLNQVWFAADFPLKNAAPLPVSALFEPVDGNVNWYFTEFEFSQPEKNTAQWGLRLTSIKDHASIWLNGEFVAEKKVWTACASYDVTSLLRNGLNRLTLCLTDKDQLQRPFGAVDLFQYLFEEDLKKGKYFSSAIPAYPSWLEQAVFYEINLTHPPELPEMIQLANTLSELGAAAVCLPALMMSDSITTLEPFADTSRYRQLNPQLGQRADFLKFVQTLHDSGLYAIADFDVTPFMNQNKVLSGKPTANPTSTEDVIDEAFSNSIIQILKYWLNQTHIDGFRFLKADLLPVSFWKKVRQELLKLKPVIIVGEADNPQFNATAFDVTYSKAKDEYIQRILAGQYPLTELTQIIRAQYYCFPRGSSVLHAFHDYGAKEIFSPATRTQLEKISTILAVTAPGNPLILFPHQNFSGESALPDSQKYFLQILGSLYYQFAPLIKNGEFRQLNTNTDERVLVFERKSESGRILVLLNLTDQEIDFNLETGGMQGFMQEIFRKIKLNLSGTRTRIRLKPWEHRIYINAQFRVLKRRSVYIPVDNPA